MIPGDPQKLYENFTYIKIPQILTLTPILSHSPTLGGASGGQNLKMALPGGYLEDRIWVLWNFCPIFGHLTLFRWLKLQILTLVVYHHPLSINNACNITCINWHSKFISLNLSFANKHRSDKVIKLAPLLGSFVILV